MTVQVKHNGTDVTTSVVAYSTQQKMCTGIGTLNISVNSHTMPNVTTWDHIDIYENSVHKNRYYVSEITTNQPDSNLTLACQDGTKKLVDTMLIDSHIIDYPSYTRYWIEYFLDEEGISYNFTTSSYGQLMSNLTELGLKTLYEQLTILLQMSGWYMYYDASDTLIIGDMEKDLSDIDFSFGVQHIKSAEKITDDKMLRNRAVIYGGYDAYNEQQISVDVHIHTPWNYSTADQRAMVISNTNISSIEDAYDLANVALNEFATITKIKVIDIIGHYDVNLGDMVRIASTVYTGTGLVTSIGTSMSNLGNITHLVLDERCPRLFGFFNFGDYVYVGTYGSGVWRKNIKFGTAWSNYSTGLDDLRVVDLHVSNGVLACVTANGDAYTNNTSLGYWTQFTILNLETIVEDGEEDILGSGIMASGIKTRACILDRDTNNVTYICDTYSGESPANILDYYYPSGILSSGYTQTSGIYRSWLVSQNSSGYHSVPLHHENNYALKAVDVETDGKFLYASVLSRGADIDTSEGYFFGDVETTIGDATSNIESCFDFYPTNEYDVNAGDSYREYICPVNEDAELLGVYDNTLTNEMYAVYSLSNEEVSPYPAKADIVIVKMSKEYSSGDPYIDDEVFEFEEIHDGTAIYATRISDDIFHVYTILYNGTEASTLWLSILTLSTLNVTSSCVESIQYVGGSFGEIQNVGYRQVSAVVNGKIANSRYFFVKASDDSVSLGVGLFVYDTNTGKKTYTINTIGANTTATFSTGTSTPYPYLLAVNGNFRVYMLGLTYETDVTFKFKVKIATLYAGEDVSGFTYLTDILYLFSTVNTITKVLLSTSMGTKYKNSNFLICTRFHCRVYDPISYDVDEDESYFTVCVDSSGAVTEATESYETQYPLANSTLMLPGSSPPCITTLHSPDRFMYVSPASNTILDEVEASNGYEIIEFLGAKYIESSTGDSQYVACVENLTTVSGIGIFSESKGTISDFQEGYEVSPQSSTTFVKARGNFIVQKVRVDTYYYYISIAYFANENEVTLPSIGAVLAVDAADNIEVVQVTTDAIRLDVSRFSPLYTVAERVSSQKAFYIKELGYTEYTSTIVSGMDRVTDFRYAQYGGSGEASTLCGLYSASGVINSTDMRSLSTASGIITINDSINHLETTNNVYPDQYFFVSSVGSGTAQKFYQKDVNTTSFIDKTFNLPESEITIIRVDDRV